MSPRFLTPVFLVLLYAISMVHPLNIPIIEAAARADWLSDEMVDTGGDFTGERMRRQAGKQIMELRLTCPDADVGTGSLILITSNDAVAVADCMNGNISFTRISTTMLELKLALRNAPQPGECKLYKSASRGSTYSVIASYAPGTKKNAVFMADHRENAMCSYDDNGHAHANLTRILDPLTRPDDLPVFKGMDIREKLDMEVLNVLDEVISGQPVNMGHWIRLRAVIYSPTKVIYPIYCKANNSDGSERYIIKGSCGAGQYIPKNEGFVALGNYTYSPYFEAFALNGKRDLLFTCLFATCLPPLCDKKSSCPYAGPNFTLPPVIVPPP